MKKYLGLLFFFFCSVAFGVIEYTDVTFKRNAFFPSGAYITYGQNLSGAIVVDPSGLVRIVQPGASGNVLLSDGNNFISGPNPAGFANPMTMSGQMIYEDGTPAPAALNIGLQGQVLVVSAGFPVWGSLNLSDTVSGGWSGVLPVSAGGTSYTDWTLHDSATILSEDWIARTLFDSAAVSSIDWSNRHLYNPAGTVLLDWSGSNLLLPQLTGVNTNNPGGQFEVDASAATTIGAILKGSPGQTADLLQVQDNTGVLLANVTYSGAAIFSGFVQAPLFIGPLSGTASSAVNLIGGASGSVPYQSNVDTTAMLPIGLDGQVLIVSGGLPIWGADSGITTLTGDVSAIGPGSAVATVTGINGVNIAGLGSGIVFVSGGLPSIALPNQFPTLNQSTTGNAGGLSGGVSGDVPYQIGPSSTVFLPIGSSGQVLTVSGGYPFWASASAGFVNPMMASGDIIFNNSALTPAALNIGLDGQVLTVSAGLPIWASAASGGFVNPMTASGDIIINDSALMAIPLHIGGSGYVLTVSGGFPTWEPAVPAGASYSFSAVTGNYTLQLTDQILAADAAGGSFTLTFPPASSLPGKFYTISKVTGVNVVLLAPNGGDTLIRETSQKLNASGASITLISDGISNWIAQ